MSEQFPEITQSPVSLMLFNKSILVNSWKFDGAS